MRYFLKTLKLGIFIFLYLTVPMISRGQDITPPPNPTMDETSKPQHATFELGANFHVEYSDADLSLISTKLDPKITKTKGIGSFEGGLALNYYYSNRVRFDLGVSYAQRGYNTAFYIRDDSATKADLSKNQYNIRHSYRVLEVPLMFAFKLGQGSDTSGFHIWPSIGVGLGYLLSTTVSVPRQDSGLSVYNDYKYEASSYQTNLMLSLTAMAKIEFSYVPDELVRIHFGPFYRRNLLNSLPDEYNIHFSDKTWQVGMEIGVSFKLK